MKFGDNLLAEFLTVEKSGWEMPSEVGLEPMIPGSLIREGSVRVLVWRWRGYGFKPHRRHCVVSLSKGVANRYNKTH